MAKILAVLFGAIFGFFAGTVTSHLLVDFETSRVERAIGGALVGVLAGIFGSSAGCDLIGQAAKDNTRAILGMFSGALSGAFGATQSSAIVELLRGLYFQLWR